VEPETTTRSDDTIDGFRELLARLRGTYPSLSAAERRVADTIEADPEVLLRLPLKALAEMVDVSEATVVRFCQSIGYEGLRGLKRELAIKAIAPTRLVHQAVQPGDDVRTIAEKVLQADMSALSDTLAVLDHEALAAAVDALVAAPRIECYATGSSVPVAVDAYYRLLRLGLPASVVTDAHMQATSAAHLPEGAVVLAVSHRGRSAEIHTALRWARQAGATCILLTSFNDTPVGRLSDISLVVAAPELSLRPEAVSSRIAHLAVIDALSVAIALRQPEQTRSALLRDDEIIAEREMAR
jgi:RpiR family transcriptional regulator, carbohydrate utilization regulator